MKEILLFVLWNKKSIFAQLTIKVSTGTPHDNLTECYLCHAIRQALVDIVVHLRNHVIGLILQLVANLFTTFQCLFMCAAVSISETCFC